MNNFVIGSIFVALKRANANVLYVRFHSFYPKEHGFAESALLTLIFVLLAQL